MDDILVTGRNDDMLTDFKRKMESVKAQICLAQTKNKIYLKLKVHLHKAQITIPKNPFTKT